MNPLSKQSGRTEANTYGGSWPPLLRCLREAVVDLIVQMERKFAFGIASNRMRTEREND